MIDRSSLVDRSIIIVSFPRVSNISHVSTVPISDIIGDSLCATIRQSYAVRARGRIAITTLSSLEVSTRVVIIDSIFILIDSRLIIGSRGLVSRGSVVGRGLVHRGSMVPRGYVARGMVCTSKGEGGDQNESLTNNTIEKGFNKLLGYLHVYS